MMNQNLSKKLEGEENIFDDIYITKNLENMRSCSPLEVCHNNYTGVLSIIDENTLDNYEFTTNKSNIIKNVCCATDTNLAETKCFRSKSHTNMKKQRMINDIHVVSRNRLEKSAAHSDKLKETNIHDITQKSEKYNAEKEIVGARDNISQSLSHEEINEMISSTKSQKNCRESSNKNISYFIARQRLERFVEVPRTCNTTNIKSRILSKRRRSLAALYVATILVEEHPKRKINKNNQMSKLL